VEESSGITIVELIVRCKRWAEGYYRKNGTVTSELAAILSAVKFLKQMYGREPANEFGLLRLLAVQQAMVLADWTRKNVNKQVQRIVRMFRWGVSQEVVRPDVAQALRSVPGLHKRRTVARETHPVLPVDDNIVNATLDHLTPTAVTDASGPPVRRLGPSRAASASRSQPARTPRAEAPMLDPQSSIPSFADQGPRTDDRAEGARPAPLPPPPAPPEARPAGRDHDLVGEAPGANHGEG
jgi:hypothetical protein